MEIIRSFDNDKAGGDIEIVFNFNNGRQAKIEVDLDGWGEMYRLITTGQFQAWKREQKGSVVSHFYSKSEDIIKFFREKYQDEVY